MKIDLKIREPKVAGFRILFVFRATALSILIGVALMFIGVRQGIDRAAEGTTPIHVNAELPSSQSIAVESDLADENGNEVANVKIADNDPTQEQYSVPETEEQKVARLRNEHVDAYLKSQGNDYLEKINHFTPYKTRLLGDAGVVCDGNTVALWHFNESSGNFTDSCGGHTATNVGLTPITGKINGGQDGTGGTKYATAGVFFQNVSGGITEDLWINGLTSGIRNFIGNGADSPATCTTNGSKGLALYTRASPNRIIMGSQGVDKCTFTDSGGAVFGSSAWHHIVGSWDGTTNANGMNLYVDGTLVASCTSNITATTNAPCGWSIGAGVTHANPGLVFYDEVRISNIARDQSWVTDQFNKANDTSSPTVSSVSSSLANGSYTTGQVVPIQVTFSEAVNVTGTPQITLSTGSPITTAINYSSGSGSTVLTFNYTVAAGNSSADLDYSSTSALALNGGSIKDVSGNAASLTLASPGGTNSLGANKAIVIQTTGPTVSGVTSSTANGSYTTGMVIPIQVTFTSAVNVVGTPQITISTGSPATTAVNYTSGSGTSTLTFNYTVAAGNSSADLDYASISALTSGTSIKDAAGNNATLTLASPGATNSLGANKAIVIDTTVPTVTGVTSSTANGTKGTGQVVSIQVNFSENVTVVGTPQLTLSTGSPATTAVNYTSGSGTSALTFNYTVAAGNNSADLDYASTSALSAGTSIRDAAGNDATRTLASPGATNSLGANKDIVIDTTAPTVTGVSSSLANGPYGTGQVVPIQVNFSESVTVVGTPQITLSTGSPATTAVNYTSGSGTSTLTFNYTVAANNASADLDYASTSALSAGTSIRDAAGNDATRTLASPGATNSLGANKDIVIDTSGPTVTGVTSSLADGAYGLGQVVPIQVNFSENVIVVGTPRITLSTGSPATTAVNYTSGSGTSTLTFNYTVAAGNNSADLDYASTSALALNGGTIKDSTGNAATLTLASPGATDSLGANKAIVIDTAGPTVSGVTSSLSNGTYGLGQVVPVQVNFSESVTVVGTPRITLSTGSPATTAVNYTSGSGTSTLSFNYTVAANNGSADLDYVSTSALALNGGTIKDSSGNNATLTLASPGATNSLGANKDIVIVTDNPVPTTTSISPTSKVEGSATFNLTVNGTNFLASSVVRIGGSDRTTTFVSAAQLNASIPDTDVASHGTSSVTVFNPTPGGGASNAQTLTVTNPVPTTTSISPTTKNVGDATFTLSVNGTNFNTSSVVFVDNVARTTTFVGSTLLEITVLASEMVSGGAHAVKVTNPAPGGGTSGTQTLTVNNPLPTTFDFSPTTAQAGTAGFTLTVLGTDFVPTSVVRWNGSSRTTTFVDSGTLTAAITAGDIATAGTATITVLNATPGGGTSNAQDFVITSALSTTCTTSGSNITISSPCQFAVGTYSFTGTLTISAAVAINSIFPSAGQVVIESDNINVTSTGSLNANNKGFAVGTGPGAGAALNQGGTHGGRGGLNGTAVYGSVREPVTNGSGAFSGEPGGGSVKLVASGTLTINGRVTASAQFVGGCLYNGGAGGSVWLQAGALAGSGTVSANGGSGRTCGGGNPSGGGGGRVAVYYSAGSPSITYSASGGQQAFFSSQSGSAGTIYVHGPNSDEGSLTINNAGITLRQQHTLLPDADSRFDTLALSNGGQLEVASGQSLEILSSSTMTGTGLRSLLYVAPGGQFLPESPTMTLTNVDLTNFGSTGGVLADLTLNTAALTEGGESFQTLTSLTVNSGGSFISASDVDHFFTTVQVNSGGLLTHLSNTSTQTYGLSLVATNFFLSAGASVNVIAKGYASSFGPGAGQSVAVNGSGGGGHGGFGGDGSVGVGGFPYDSAAAPVLIGSGGGGTGVQNGGAGGGRVRISADSLTVNGTISANGGGSPSNYSGGGSGGSILLQALGGTLAGTGTITSNGGGTSNSAGGCGAGGYVILQAGTNSFSGTKTANGGTSGCVNDGGAGIVSGVATPPSITAITPTTAVAGSAGFTVTVNGSNFIPTSVVKVAGASRATTFVSSAQLTASVLAADLTTGGPLAISVANGDTESVTSNARTFLVSSGTRTLTIDAGSLATVYALSATPPTITSTSSAGTGARTYTSSTPAVCTIGSSTGIVAFVSAGTCTIGASIASDGSFDDATANPASFEVTSVATVTVTHSPEDVFINDLVTLSGSLSHSGGLARIEIYLDGIAPGNLVRTCTLTGSPTTADCSFLAGKLTYGGHVTTVKAFGSDSSEFTGSEAFHVSNSTTVNSVQMGRMKHDEPNAVKVNFRLQGTLSGPLVVTFPVGFAVTGAPTANDSSDCLSGFGFNGPSRTIFATKSSCSGQIFLGGAMITNPTALGIYRVDWVNDDPGFAFVLIIEEDQVDVTAAVAATLTFNVGAQVPPAANCNGTFAGNGGTVALGMLTISKISSSDVDGVNHICSRLTSNASGGTVVSVSSPNNGLASLSVPGDVIDSANGEMVAGVENYGLCDSTEILGSNSDGIVPTREDTFNGDCFADTAVGTVGAVTAIAKPIWSVPSPVLNAFVTIVVKAAISSTTPAHDDYVDTLIFTATASF